MASWIDVPDKSDDRGHLVVLQDQIPFQIRRVFYIYGVAANMIRGGHRHKKTRMILVSVSGSCSVLVNNGTKKKIFELNKPDLCLLIEPEDFHSMLNFSPSCVLLVLASLPYDPHDYIHQDYSND